MSDASYGSPTVFRQVDAICDRFEKQLRSGQCPRIEAALGGLPGTVRTHALRELLLIEIEFCKAGGECPTAEQYAARFPQDGDVLDAVFADLTPTAETGQPRNSDALTSVVLEVTDGPHQGKRFEFCLTTASSSGAADKPTFSCQNTIAVFPGCISWSR